MYFFSVKRFFAMMCALGVCTISQEASASAFQLFQQEAGSLGNAGAGYAVSEEDASAAFYNPAALTTLKHQQLIVSGMNVFSRIKFRGEVKVNTISSNFMPATAEGGGYSFVPAFFYATPLNKKIFFGFSISVPFGLKADYGRTTSLKYVTTKTAIQVINISPVLAVKLTDKLSVGAGPDFQIANGEFDQVAGYTVAYSADGINNANDTALGYHAGLYYELSNATKLGLSYHSQVVHHLRGTSQLSGDLASALGLPDLPSERSKLNITLPPYVAASVSKNINSRLTLLGTITYTQWNTIKHLVLQNVSGVIFNDSTGVFEASNSIVVNIPQYFKNTLSYSLGANYQLSEKVMLRGGLGYDQTPVNPRYRNPQLPDNNHFNLALGGHYQATNAFGFDLGYMHIFARSASISPPTQVTGAENATVVGHVNGSANVIGLQMVWNIN